MKNVFGTKKSFFVENILNGETVENMDCRPLHFLASLKKLANCLNKSTSPPIVLRSAPGYVRAAFVRAAFDH